MRGNFRRLLQAGNSVPLESVRVRESSAFARDFRIEKEDQKERRMGEEVRRAFPQQETERRGRGKQEIRSGVLRRVHRLRDWFVKRGSGFGVRDDGTRAVRGEFERR